MIVEILIKKEAESVDEAVLLQWMKKENEHVTKGDVIAVAESYKAIMEVEALEDGIISDILVREGQKFELPAVLGHMKTEKEASALTGPVQTEKSRPSKEETCPTEALPIAAGNAGEARERRISPAARKYAMEKGISLNYVFERISKQVIKKEDVEGIVALYQGTGESQLYPAREEGKVSADFFRGLKENQSERSNFASLSSSEKVSLLRAAGAIIEDDVRLAEGSIIIAKRIRIGSHTKIGKNCYFEAEDIDIGRMACFENNVDWRCKKIRVGDMFYCAAEARVGWGGEFGSHAELWIGDNSFFGEQAMLNPSRKITIEAEVAIGAGSKLYTHQFWQSVLDGYNASHAPITVHSNVQIGANVVILPGVCIGSGSTIMANSTVTFNVKESHLMAGVPAVSMGKVAYPRKLTADEKMHLAKKLINEFIKEQGYEHYMDPTNSEPEEWKGREAKIVYLPFWDKTKFKEDTGVRTLVIISGNYVQGSPIPGNVTFFFLGDKHIAGNEDKISDLLREFLRKRGIRFSPIYWRYKYTKDARL